MLSAGGCIGPSKVIVSCGRDEQVRSESWPTGTEAGQACSFGKEIKAHTIEGNSRVRDGSVHGMGTRRTSAVIGLVL